MFCLIFSKRRKKDIIWIMFFSWEVTPHSSWRELCITVFLHYGIKRKILMNQVLTLSYFKKKTNSHWYIFRLRTGNSHCVGNKRVWHYYSVIKNCQVCSSYKAFIVKRYNVILISFFLLFLGIHFNISHVLKY